MTIDEAIEILTLMGTPEFRGHTEDILAARQLSIEALKACKARSDRFPNLPHLRLPGETAE